MSECRNIRKESGRSAPQTDQWADHLRHELPSMELFLEKLMRDTAESMGISVSELRSLLQASGQKSTAATTTNERRPLSPSPPKKK